MLDNPFWKNAFTKDYLQADKTTGALYTSSPVTPLDRVKQLASDSAAKLKKSASRIQREVKKQKLGKWWPALSALLLLLLLLGGVGIYRSSRSAAWQKQISRQMYILLTRIPPFLPWVTYLAATIVTFSRHVKKFFTRICEGCASRADMNIPHTLLSSTISENFWDDNTMWRLAKQASILIFTLMQGKFTGFPRVIVPDIPVSGKSSGVQHLSRIWLCPRRHCVRQWQVWPSAASFSRKHKRPSDIQKQSTASHFLPNGKQVLKTSWWLLSVLLHVKFPGRLQSSEALAAIITCIRSNLSFSIRW